MISTGRHNGLVKVYGQQFIPVGTKFCHADSGLCGIVVEDNGSDMNCPECIFDSICNQYHDTPVCTDGREDGLNVIFKPLEDDLNRKK